MNELSICIPVFNQFQYTKSCISDLLHLPKSHTIIVMDNGSTDQTKELESFDNVLVYHLDKNFGFSSACNCSYEIAKNLSENVMFLNNDIKVMNNHSIWTFPIINRCKEGLVGPTLGVLNENFEFVCEGSKLPTNRKNIYMSGWCISSSVDNWERLRTEKIRLSSGPFSEITHCYFEDTDLGFRARELGIPFIIEEIPVRHLKNGTSKTMNLSKMYQDSKKIFTEKWKNK